MDRIVNTPWWRSLPALGVLVATAAACSSTAAVPSDAALPSVAPSHEPSFVPASADAVIVRAGEPWVAFQQFPGKSLVTLARPDGSGLHSPTTDVPGGDQTNPDWSPDGTQLVFAVASGATEVLWVVNADGTDARLLVDCQDECLWVDDPDWSPDGRTILFSRVSEGADAAVIATLEQVDVASGDTRVLVQADPGHFYAGQRWSPDAASIVLEVVALADAAVGSDIDDVSLAIIDVAAPSPAGRELIGSGRFPETAAWAPGGDEIVFAALAAAGSASGTDLYAIHPDGSGLRQITTLGDEGGNATHPDVSPDGSSVIFVATRPGSSESVLGQVPIGGGEVTPAISEDFLDGVHPRIRPQL